MESFNLGLIFPRTLALGKIQVPTARPHFSPLANLKPSLRFTTHLLLHSQLLRS